ncbi:MerR family transcriptional regulator [Ruegeria sp. R13_0]|uniref:MerR family transcriptional regulator n=1 Tax=Ruegeria sp. R13_0 TaxID=2821099 RepID=UPI001ADAE3E1|nr:MerR family transcriptional regulator [Ruegeria sp. R13_0]MBO9436959.1 MerR family transcriptional regulator [Ruegeria sp. R13_0]
METRIEEYTVGELAKVAGVSVRMLHHYDAIGLLKPSHVAANGYRIYRQPEAIRLQEILFYRAIGMALQDIANMLEHGGQLDRLTKHREELKQRLADHAAMIATLDRTISHLTGDAPMMIEDLYKPFSAAKQADYEDWLTQTYSAEMVQQIAHAEQAGPDFAQDGANRLRAIEAALVSDYEGGKPSDQADLSAHQAWVADMWGRPCNDEAYAQLSDIYMAHPDFVARFEALSEGYSQWLRAAMVSWTNRT